jgi:hypothetical protein
MKEAITIILFSLVNVGLAAIDANKIFKSKAILHGLNGALYIAMLVVPYLLFKDYWLIAVLLFDRLIFFNISLSLFRRFNWDYISPKPKSIIDKIAYSIFKDNSELMYFIYIVIFAILITKIYIW